MRRGSCGGSLRDREGRGGRGVTGERATLQLTAAHEQNKTEQHTQEFRNLEQTSWNDSAVVTLSLLVRFVEYWLSDVGGGREGGERGLCGSQLRQEGADWGSLFLAGQPPKGRKEPQHNRPTL